MKPCGYLPANQTGFCLNIAAKQLSGRKLDVKTVAKCNQLCPLTVLKIGCNVGVHILVDVEGLRFNKKAIEFS